MKYFELNHYFLKCNSATTSPNIQFLDGEEYTTYDIPRSHVTLVKVFRLVSVP